jgi:hypothetical protein
MGMPALVDATRMAAVVINMTGDSLAAPMPFTGARAELTTTESTSRASSLAWQSSTRPLHVHGGVEQVERPTERTTLNIFL